MADSLQCFQDSLVVIIGWPICIAALLADLGLEIRVYSSQVHPLDIYLLLSSGHASSSEFIKGVS